MRSATRKRQHTRLITGSTALDRHRGHIDPFHNNSLVKQFFSWYVCLCVCVDDWWLINWLAPVVCVLHEAVLLKRKGSVAVAGVAGKAFCFRRHVMISTIIFTLNLFELELAVTHERMKTLYFWNQISTFLFLCKISSVDHITSQHQSDLHPEQGQGNRSHCISLKQALDLGSLDHPRRSGLFGNSGSSRNNTRSGMRGYGLPCN